MSQPRSRLRWLPGASLKDADEVSLPPLDAIRFSLGILWAD